MEKISKLKIPLVLIVLLIIVFSYHWLFRGYFQHDEWIAFGEILSRKNDFLTTITGFFAPNKDHYVPIFQIIFYIYLKLFKFNFGFYALLSIFLHLIVTFLVYLFSIKIFKNWKKALFAASFFGLSSSLYQATSWVWYDINSHYSAVFALISLIFFWNFLQKEKIKKLYYSILFLIISLLIKESAIGFFILYPVSIIIFKGWKCKNQLRYYSTILIPGFIYFMVRFSMFFIPGAYEDNPDVFNMQKPSNILINLVTMPAKVLLQTLFPQQLSLSVSRWITHHLPRFVTGIPGTTQFDIFVEQRTLQLLSVVAFIFVVVAVYLIWKHNRKQNLVKISIFSLAYIIVNSFIYAFSPGRIDIFSLVDSRNLYLPTIGTGVLLISMLALITKNSLVKISIIMLPLIFYHTIFLNYKLSAISLQGAVRKSILIKFKKEYPNLSPKTVFYTESDTSYYGMPENEKILPFEVGFGKTLMSWYQLEEGYPRTFLDKHFLWDLTSQGYIEEGNQGFGYFRDINLLRKIVKENKLNADCVIAYRFNSRDNSVTDITREVRKKIIY